MVLPLMIIWFTVVAQGDGQGWILFCLCLPESLTNFGAIFLYRTKVAHKIGNFFYLLILKINEFILET